MAQRLKRTCLAVLMVLLTGCAKTTHGSYPESWPALAKSTPGCADIPGTYSQKGRSYSDERQDAVLGTLLDASSRPGQMQGHLGNGATTIRLSFTEDGKLQAEALQDNRVIATLIWEKGEDGYQCDEAGLQIPPGPYMGVLGYNSHYRVLAKAVDGALILRDTSSAYGVWVLPPIPMASNSTYWARFEAVQ